MGGNESSLCKCIPAGNQDEKQNPTYQEILDAKTNQNNTQRKKPPPIIINSNKNIEFDSINDENETPIDSPMKIDKFLSQYIDPEIIENEEIHSLPDNDVSQQHNDVSEQYKELMLELRDNVSEYQISHHQNQNLDVPLKKKRDSFKASITQFSDGTAILIKKPKVDDDGVRIIEITNGDYYKGHLNEEGHYHGYGEYYSKNDGYVYKGNWNNMVKEGKGREEYSDGRFYIGNFDNNEPNGYGIITWPDGSRYSGRISNGVRTGYGMYEFDKGQYEGNFVNGKFLGEGEIVYKNGTKFIGQFLNGYENRRGKLEMEHGKSLSGCWVNDKLEGEVYLASNYGSSVSTVFYRRGVKAGQGLQEQAGSRRNIQEMLDKSEKIISKARNSLKSNTQTDASGKMEKMSPLKQKSINHMESANKNQLRARTVYDGGNLCPNKKAITKELKKIDLDPMLSVIQKVKLKRSMSPTKIH